MRKCSIASLARLVYHIYNFKHEGVSVPSAQELIRSIEANLARMHAYELWKIGIATDPDQRQAELDYPGFWRFWKADSLADARDVVRHFVQRGMKQDGEHGKDPLFVYLY
ncbi:MAG: hypothetical protein N2255_09040 [Kiritimatiellae bacterium]|nr:hypothetical protein [Kiritimatiellia bacterium]